MPPRTLPLVDLRDDSCIGGALTVSEGDSTVDVANRLIDWRQSRGEAVIVSQDWHPASRGSFTSQHGVKSYTPGQLGGLPQTFWSDRYVRSSEDIQLHPLLKQKAIAAMFHRDESPLADSYSVFFDNGRRQETVLDDWLHAYVISELIVMGLATDYCVKLTVSDVLQLGYKVNAITDGCRSVNIQPQDSAYAFMEMPAARATLYILADWEETRE